MFMLHMVSLKAKRNFISLMAKISEIRIKLVKDRKPLKGNKLKDFENFLEVYANKVVEKWVDYFVYHKDVEFEKITKLK